MSQPQVATQPPKYLFVVGCPRSGTTALTKLLNTDSRIILGMERFKYIAPRIKPFHFTGSIFYQPTVEETNLQMPEFYAKAQAKQQAGGIVYIGDKVPAYFRQLPYLVRTFPACKILFLQRDLLEVASSYNVRAVDPADHWPIQNDYRVAAQHWDESLQCLQQFVKQHGREQIFIVQYSQLFMGDESYLKNLYDFLDLTPTRAVYKRFGLMTQDWAARQAKSLTLTQDMKIYLQTHRNTNLERWCLELANS